jgi:antitoxin component YwqK of YwqJK toxin-antitoxin module
MPSRYGIRNLRHAETISGMTGLSSAWRKHGIKTARQACAKVHSASARIKKSRKRGTPKEVFSARFAKKYPEGGIDCPRLRERDLTHQSKKLMKRSLTSVIVIALVVFLHACSGDDDAAKTPINAEAKINGQAFATNESTATDIGSGMEIALKSGTEEISFVLGNKTAGTYNVINAGGRVNSATSAVATYVKGGDPYFATTGSITLTLGADGKASGTFNLTVKNAGGAILTITDGKLTNITVNAAPPPSACLISKMTYSYKSGNSTETYSENFYYNAQGNLIKIEWFDAGRLGGTYQLIWAGGKVVKAVTDENGKVDFQVLFFYSGNNLARTVYLDNDGDTYEFSYELNAAGQPTKETYKDGGSSSTSTHTYDSRGNGVSSVFSAGGSNTFSNYDDKNTPWSLLAKAMGLSFYPDFEAADGYSKNNVGKRVYKSDSFTTEDTFTYTYNSRGYPTFIVEISKSDGGTSTYTTTIEYKGCN